MGFLLIFLGAGVGGVLRQSVNLAAVRLVGRDGFPLATLLVNVSGSFVMGLVSGYLLQRPDVPPEVRLFLTTGVLGGYTTFSAFSLENVTLLARGQLLQSLLYTLLSISLSFTGLALGLLLVRTSLR